MESLTEAAARIADLEARQEDALRQLDALERRLEQVLLEHGGIAARALSPAEGTPLPAMSLPALPLPAASHLVPAVKAA